MVSDVLRAYVRHHDFLPCGSTPMAPRALVNDLFERSIIWPHICVINKNITSNGSAGQAVKVSDPQIRLYGIAPPSPCPEPPVVCNQYHHP